MKILKASTLATGANDSVGNKKSKRSLPSYIPKLPLRKSTSSGPSITVDGVTRLKEYTELTPAEAIQADCDIKAINIILQAFLTEIYALVSQHRVARSLEQINCS
ncbi:hypothetical protein Tco_1361671 [Tanacetum coccineum]